MTTQQENYGLVGYPLGHSFSRRFFTEKFEREGRNAIYENFEIPEIDRLPAVIDEKTGLKGFNVTIPYKQQVMKFLDELDDVAKRIGAVNTVKVMHVDGKRYLKGFNTDIIGFCDSLKPLLTSEMTYALVLGTGGASKAVMVGLQLLGITPINVSRRPADGVITYGDITPELMAKCLLVVNTTPLGMYPKVDACPDIPYELMTSEHLCYDLVYNPEVTMFMRKAAEHGARTKNGGEMLERQACAAWDIWQK